MSQNKTKRHLLINNCHPKISKTIYFIPFEHWLKIFKLRRETLKIYIKKRFRINNLT